MVKNLANIEECCKLLNKYFIDRGIIGCNDTFNRYNDTLKVFMSPFITPRVNQNRKDLQKEYILDKNKYINYVIEHIGPFLIDYNIEKIMFTYPTENNGPMYSLYKINSEANINILTKIGESTTEVW